jgi:hypothetical protein
MRWAGLLYAAAVAVSLVLLALRWQQPRLSSFLELPGWVIACLAIAVLEGARRVERPRLGALLGFRHPLVHPPLVLGGLLGASAVIWLLAGFPALRSGLQLIDGSYEALAALGRDGVIVFLCFVVAAELPSSKLEGAFGDRLSTQPPWCFPTSPGALQICRS